MFLHLLMKMIKKDTCLKEKKNLGDYKLLLKINIVLLQLIKMPQLMILLKKRKNKLLIKNYKKNNSHKYQKILFQTKIENF